MKACRFTKSVLPFLTACVIALSACGPAPKAELSKEEIIRKAWKAMFGEINNEDIHSLYAEGLFHGSAVPNRMTVKRPNLFRNEVESGILVFDGKRAAWIKQEPDEKGNPKMPELIEPKSWRHFEIDIAIVFPAFFDFPAEYQGREAVNGTDAYKIHVNLPLGGKITYFIDPTSFLVKKRLVNWNGVEGELWENLVDDYVKYDGVLFPDGYRYQGRNGQEKGIYQNVKINVNPAAELFQIPEELLK